MIMLAPVRRTITGAFAAALLSLASCGGDDAEKGDPSGLAREAGAAVEQLERSLAAGEYSRICDELLSAEVRRQAGGGDCPGQLERTSGGLKRPDIEVKTIQIRGAGGDRRRGHDGGGPGAHLRHDPARARSRELQDLVAQRLRARSVPSKSVRAMGPTQGDVAPASK